MNRCKTCQHWRRFKKDLNFHGPYAGTCDSDRFVYDEDLPKDGLEYWDYEGYYAGFHTGEDFGCIHWEVKE